MTIFEIIKCIFCVLEILLLAIMAIVLHRIGTIRKWEIEKEREKKRGNGHG